MKKVTKISSLIYCALLAALGFVVFKSCVSTGTKYGAVAEEYQDTIKSIDSVIL